MSQIFSAMELTDMLERLWQEEGITEEKTLTDRNVETVKAFFIRHWEEVPAHYEDQIKAAGQYYEKVLRGIRSAAAIDIGWAGSGALALSHMVKKVWKLDCDIIGIVAGTNSCHTYEGDGSEPQMENGRLVSYLFSQRDNRDLWKFHNPGKNHNLYWELLTGSDTGSLKGFYPKAAGSYQVVLKDTDENAEKVRMIHKGILDFTDCYLRVMGEERLKISGRDAYAPMLLAEQEWNKGYMRRLENLLDEADVG